MNNDYMRQYMANRYERRKEAAIEQLGGRCVKCGSTEKLEFDHIDPSIKAFSVTERLAGVSEKRLQEELTKCQLLCSSCHNKKHHTGKTSHGTLASYRYCKCAYCREAWNKWNREYRRKRRRHAS